VFQISKKEPAIKKEREKCWLVDKREDKEARPSSHFFEARPELGHLVSVAFNEFVDIHCLLARILLLLNK
jgi:hypothetical protein